MRRSFLRLGLVAACILGGAQRGEAIYESSLTLPKGVSRIRGVAVVTEPVVHSYNPNGTLEPLAQPLNRSVSVNQVVAAGLASKDSKVQLQAKQLQALQSGLNNLNPQARLGDKLFQVDLKAKASVGLRQFVPAYEYGISNGWSVGIAVPIVQVNIDSSVEAQMQSNELELAKKPTVRAVGLDAALKEFSKIKESIPQSVIDGAFTSKGYEIPSARKYQALGEVEIGVKRNWFRFEKHSFSTQLSTRLPTSSRSKDYRHVFDPGVGDGSTDVYTVFTYDFMPVPAVRLGTALRLTAQLPDREYRPVARPDETALPDLNDPYIWDEVQRDLGDEIDYEVSAHYGFWQRRFEFSTLYAYHLEGHDTFRGSKELDYEKLEEGSSKRSHQYEVGLKFSTVHEVLKKGRGVPFELRLAFNDTFAGTNALETTYYRMDLNLYFR